MATMKRLITRNNGDVIFLSTFYMNGWINDDDDDTLGENEEILLSFPLRLAVHLMCPLFHIKGR